MVNTSASFLAIGHLEHDMAAIEELQKHALEFQERTGIRTQISEEKERLFVVLQKVPLPQDLFSVCESDVLFITDKQYPFSAMDMFWTELEVVHPDGSIPTNADCVEEYIGRKWRRFSWHRNNVWNPAGNPLLDHFAFMEARWAVEVKR